MMNTEGMECTDILSEASLPSDAEIVRYGVRVGTLYLLLPSQTLNEVVDEGEIYPVPNTPKWFKGVINHRGNIISIFDLKELFFDEECCTSQDNQSHTLVVGKGDGAVGFLIDTLPQAINFEKVEEESSVKIPTILKRHSTLGESGVWMEVDFLGLFEEVGGLVLS